MSTSNTSDVAGRNALIQWKAAQPRNFFRADPLLGGLLERSLGEADMAELRPRLERFGAQCATELDPLVDAMEHRLALPRLERWNGIGQRVEEVVYDERFHAAGRIIYGGGVISVLGERGGMTKAGGLAYLTNHTGEAGHNCPVACTAGIVKVLQNAASPELRERFLPDVLTPDYARRLDGAQFLTEVQGGSDVGQNAVRATPLADGTWRIDGEKWFCSNASAALFLMTARVTGPEERPGTGGLGLFLVRRTREDGSVNGFSIRRLKDKLGTRTMASGEMDFDGAIGWHMGPVGEGFHVVMNQVINTSRLYNAVGTLAMARRAILVADGYARHRVAFGRPIVQYPLVQQTLADMSSEWAPLLAVTFALLDLRDRMERDEVDAIERSAFRVLVNVNKYRTAVSAGEIIRSGIEILGGNGAIETFSPLPRLLRDNVVYENWEGTHNTLVTQVHRDLGKLGLVAPLCTWLRETLERAASASDGALSGLARRTLSDVTVLEGQLAEVAATEPGLGTLRLRPLADRIGWLAGLACLADQAAWELETRGATRWTPWLAHFHARRLASPAVLPEATALASLAALTAESA